MNLDFQDIDDQLRHVQLTGRMDSAGVDQISTKLAALVATAARRIVLDLRGVDFLASLGIRLILQNAKAQTARGGRMVLLVAANSTVAETLQTTGIPSLVPMLTEPADADAAALA